MCTKGFKVVVELDIHAVTCPGVWLCPSGRVCLKIKILGFSAKTKYIPPIFPLLFHDKFVFEKLISTCRQLSELQRYFEKEIVYAELVQKTGIDSVEEITLAAFEISLTELLYPCTSRRGVLAGVDIDLLMEPSCHFPGIIAPKVEISTKTVVEEVNLRLSDRRKAFLNPKTLRSKNVTEQIEPKEKAKMARLRGHPGTCCYVHPVSHQCMRKSSRPPFVVRHMDEQDLARAPAVHKCIPPLPALPCHRWAGKKQHCRMFVDTNKHSMQRSKSLGRVYAEENKPPFFEGCCEYSHCHKRRNCNVCKLYKCYFPNHETEKKNVNESVTSVEKRDFESNKNHQEINYSRSNSSSRDSLKNCAHYDCESKSKVKHFSDYGSCNRFTDEVSKRVKDALCQVDYPFLDVGKKCCGLCNHSRLCFASFKNSECCVSSHRPIFYKNLECFLNKLCKQVQCQRAVCK